MAFLQHDINLSWTLFIHISECLKAFCYPRRSTSHNIYSASNRKVNLWDHFSEQEIYTVTTQQLTKIVFQTVSINFPTQLRNNQRVMNTRKGSYKHPIAF